MLSRNSVTRRLEDLAPNGNARETLLRSHDVRIQDPAPKRAKEIPELNVNVPT